MGHPVEEGMAKVKLAHYLDNGDKVEFETHIEAADYKSAVATAEKLFAEALKSLAQGTIPAMRKVKLEM